MRTLDGDEARQFLAGLGSCQVEVVKYVASLSRLVLRARRNHDARVTYAVLSGCTEYHGPLKWTSTGLEVAPDRLLDTGAGVVIVGSGLVVVELEPGEAPPALAVE